MGKYTLLLRVKEHVGGKQWWSRSLLIASASDEFNSAEIGWLEGRLYDVLNNAVAAEVMNKGRPGDYSLAPQDRGVLERYVEPIMAALRACGASPDTADQRPVSPKGHKKKIYKDSVKDLIDAGLLKAGTMLVPLRKGLTRTARVLPDGSLKIGEQVFASVSPAAMAVSGTSPNRAGTSGAPPPVRAATSRCPRCAIDCARIVVQPRTAVAVHLRPLPQRWRQLGRHRWHSVTAPPSMPHRRRHPACSRPELGSLGSSARQSRPPRRGAPAPRCRALPGPQGTKRRTGDAGTGRKAGCQRRSTWLVVGGRGRRQRQ